MTAKRFMIFVIDDRSNSGTAEELLAIDAFNEALVRDDHWIVAGGLADPQTATVIDNRAGLAYESSAPLFSGPEHFSGFWLIRAADLERARELAFSASLACNRKVELRPLLG